MTRWLVAVVLATCGALSLGACGDADYDDEGEQVFVQPDCTEYTTCGGCTWVVGCGWCFSGAGPEGVCASGPEFCTKVGSHWNWDPIGCHVAADPGSGGDP